MSAAFAAAAARSHTVVTRAEVRDVSSGQVTVLRPHDGQVTVDRTRDVRRTVTATLADPDGTLTPAAAEDLLAPFGNELSLWRGLRLPGGVEELVPLGVFRVTDFTVESGPDGVTIDLEGSDRSLTVIRNRWVDPWVVASGAPTEDAIAALLADRYPDVVTNLPTMGTTTPRLVLEAGASSDPWRDARELARGSGYELYADADGVVVATVPPQLDGGTVDTTYLEGDQAVLLELSRSVSTAASVYNGVVAVGESTELAVPVRAEAWDDDPTSPTYRHGPFGQVPYFYSSPLLKTVDQAQSAANSLLASILGASEQVDWTQICHPATDAGDVVELTRSSARLEAVRIILDTVEISLSASQPMAAGGRRRFL